MKNCEYCTKGNMKFVDIEYYADVDEENNPVWFLYKIYRCDYCGIGDDYPIGAKPREVESQLPE